MIKKTLLLVNLFLFLHVATFAQKSVLLKFSPEVSKKYEMAFAYKQALEMPQFGSVATGIIMTYDFFIKERDSAKNFIIVTQYKSISVSTKTPMGDINFSTDAEVETGNFTAQLMQYIFKGMTGKDIILTIRPDGEVIKVEGFKEIIKNIFTDMGMDTLKEGKQIQQKLEESFSDEEIRKNFSDAFNILPNKEVKIGESWQRLGAGSVIKEVKSKVMNTYTLEEIDGNIAILSLKSDLSIDRTKASSAMKVNMEGTQSGTLKVDITTGLVIESNIEQDISSVADDENEAGSMKIKGTAKIVTQEID